MWGFRCEGCAFALARFRAALWAGECVCVCVCVFLCLYLGERGGLCVCVSVETPATGDAAATTATLVTEMLRQGGLTGGFVRLRRVRVVKWVQTAKVGYFLDPRTVGLACIASLSAAESDRDRSREADTAELVKS